MPRACRQTLDRIGREAAGEIITVPEFAGAAAANFILVWCIEKCNMGQSALLDVLKYNEKCR